MKNDGHIVNISTGTVSSSLSIFQLICVGICNESVRRSIYSWRPISHISSVLGNILLLKTDRKWYTGSKNTPLDLTLIQLWNQGQSIVSSRHKKDLWDNETNAHPQILCILHNTET